MDNETLKRLEGYCPEITPILNDANLYDLLTEHERLTLIADALRRRIIERGEWEAFYWFAEIAWIEVASASEDIIPGKTAMTFIRWLTDPETFIRVTEQWIRTKGEK